MSWGDAWGSSPWEYHKKLAAAFFDGRELASGSETGVHRLKWCMEYQYGRRSIARYTPPSFVPEIIAAKLAGRELKDGVDYFTMMQFRSCTCDRAEARHLQALGVEAKWQYGRLPVLAFGVDITDCEWRTIEECKAQEKWKLQPKPVQRQRVGFVNLTYPLPFPEMA